MYELTNKGRGPWQTGVRVADGRELCIRVTAYTIEYRLKGRRQWHGITHLELFGMLSGAVDGRALTAAIGPFTIVAPAGNGGRMKQVALTVEPAALSFRVKGGTKQYRMTHASAFIHAMEVNSRAGRVKRGM